MAQNQEKVNAGPPLPGFPAKARGPDATLWQDLYATLVAHGPDGQRANRPEFMEILPISVSTVPATAYVRAGMGPTARVLEPVGTAASPSALIGSARAAQTAPRFHFSDSARDALQMERWHREWAEARSSLVTDAYTALHRQRAGTLFDLAA